MVRVCVCVCVDLSFGCATDWMQTVVMHFSECDGLRCIDGQIFERLSLSLSLCVCECVYLCVCIIVSFTFVHIALWPMFALHSDAECGCINGPLNIVGGYLQNYYLHNTMAVTEAIHNQKYS